MVGYTANSRKFEKFINIKIHNLVPLKVFREGFINISYENASFLMLVCFPLGKWNYYMAAAYFLSATEFWFVKCLFPIDEKLKAKEFVLRCVYRLNQPLWKIHSICIS